jgi:hypothetical protein
MPMFNTYTDSFMAGKRPANAATGIVTATGLISYIDMGNVASYSGVGSAAYDLTVNNINATIVGAPPYSTSTQGTILLDGATQYVITNNLVSKFNPGNGTVSVDIWLRPTDNGVVLNEQGSITAPRWYDSQLEIVGGYLRMGLWNGFGIVSTTVGRVNYGTWQNYVMTYDGVTLKCYINGTLGNSLTVTKGNPWDAGYGYYYGIMGSTSLSTNLGDGTRLAGNFSLIRIYNVALSRDEVRGNFNADRARFRI